MMVGYVMCWASASSGMDGPPPIYLVVACGGLVTDGSRKVERRRGYIVDKHGESIGKRGNK